MTLIINIGKYLEKYFEIFERSPATAPEETKINIL